MPLLEIEYQDFLFKRVFRAKQLALADRNPSEAEINQFIRDDNILFIRLVFRWFEENGHEPCPFADSDQELSDLVVSGQLDENTAVEWVKSLPDGQAIFHFGFGF